MGFTILINDRLIKKIIFRDHFIAVIIVAPIFAALIKWRITTVHECSELRVAAGYEFCACHFITDHESGAWRIATCHECSVTCQVCSVWLNVFPCEWRLL